VKSAPPRSLKGRALQWLAQREHSRLELRRKLLAHAQAEDESDSAAAEDPHGMRADSDASPTPAAARVDALLDWLEANRFLSQQRFTESRIHARSSRYGNLRIRQELSQHGVALTGAATHELQGSELDRARAVWSRKFAATDAAPPDAAMQAKQGRFLIGRGFSPEVVRRVLREVATLGAPGEADRDTPG
jgi:regulatory protein